MGSIKAQDYPAELVEILVALGRSTDGTRPLGIGGAKYRSAEAEGFVDTVSLLKYVLSAQPSTEG